MYTCYSPSSTHCMCCLPHSIRSGFHTTLSFSPGREPAAVRFRLFNPLTRPRPKNRGLLQSGENSRHHPQEMNPRVGFHNLIYKHKYLFVLHLNTFSFLFFFGDITGLQLDSRARAVPPASIMSKYNPSRYSSLAAMGEEVTWERGVLLQWDAFAFVHCGPHDSRHFYWCRDKATKIGWQSQRFCRGRVLIHRDTTVSPL
ncbi:hypothetical protein B296_00029289 [Ensete ventricosum]|uniref:Uncharacterized protein n=1 Tax=Ensete ventricosum TaxID=4639 RepID=A0A426Y635_ENSVE|nr:hypothetical protein B296_00029289 [Ensete ventricosum]